MFYEGPPQQQITTTTTQPEHKTTTGDSGDADDDDSDNVSKTKTSTTNVVLMPSGPLRLVGSRVHYVDPITKRWTQGDDLRGPPGPPLHTRWRGTSLEIGTAHTTAITTRGAVSSSTVSWSKGVDLRGPRGYAGESPLIELDDSAGCVRFGTLTDPNTPASCTWSPWMSCRGPRGPLPDHETREVRAGVIEIRWQKPSGAWGEWVRLSGPVGSRGPAGVSGKRGPVGPMPRHQWGPDGTLRFQEPLNPSTAASTKTTKSAGGGGGGVQWGSRHHVLDTLPWNGNAIKTKEEEDKEEDGEGAPKEEEGEEEEQQQQQQRRHLHYDMLGLMSAFRPLHASEVLISPPTMVTRVCRSGDNAHHHHHHHQQADYSKDDDDDDAMVQVCRLPVVEARDPDDWNTVRAEEDARHRAAALPVPQHWRVMALGARIRELERETYAWFDPKQTLSVYPLVVEGVPQVALDIPIPATLGKYHLRCGAARDIKIQVSGYHTVQRCAQELVCVDVKHYDDCGGSVYSNVRIQPGVLRVLLFDESDFVHISQVHVALLPNVTSFLECEVCAAGV